MSHSTLQNSAAFIDGAGKPFVVRDAPVPTPGPDDVLVRIHAAAINPVDGFRRARGIYIADDAWPYRLGSDAAGVIAGLGSNVTSFEVGDRVTLQTDEFIKFDPNRAAFQKYAVVTKDYVVKIPESLSFKDACVLPLCLNTAAGMLFEKESLDLPWPTTDASARSKNANSIIVVWGGSSAVGMGAIQLLKAAGFRTVALASPRNFDLVKSAGAEHAFNHGDADVVQQVIKYVSDHKYHLAGVASCTPMQPGVNEACAEIVRGLPGVKAVTTANGRGIPGMEIDLGSDISVYYCIGLSQPDLRDYVWGPNGWLQQTLASGETKCLPPPDVVGQGLETIEKAVQLMDKGVSGKKLVVTDI